VRVEVARSYFSPLGSLLFLFLGSLFPVLVSRSLFLAFEYCNKRNPGSYPILIPTMPLSGLIRSRFNLSTRLNDHGFNDDRHLEPGLGHQVGISGGASASETNVGKLLRLLQKQRLVKR
jgi:hypothetical protein